MAHAGGSSRIGGLQAHAANIDVGQGLLILNVECGSKIAQVIQVGDASGGQLGTGDHRRRDGHLIEPFDPPLGGYDDLPERFRRSRACVLQLRRRLCPAQPWARWRRTIVPSAWFAWPSHSPGKVGLDATQYGSSTPLGAEYV